MIQCVRYHQVSILNRFHTSRQVRAKLWASFLAMVVAMAMETGLVTLMEVRQAQVSEKVLLAGCWFLSCRHCTMRPLYFLLKHTLSGPRDLLKQKLGLLVGLLVLQ